MEQATDAEMESEKYEAYSMTNCFATRLLRKGNRSKL